VVAGESGCTGQECSYENHVGESLGGKHMQTKIEIRKAEPQLIHVSQLRVGQFAIMTYKGDAVGDVVTRTQDGIVNLSDPFTRMPDLYVAEVEVLKVGTILELVIGDESYPALSQLTDAQRAEVKRIRDTPNDSDEYNSISGKIAAIKLVRSLTLAGLYDAKKFVESL
jgi:hypothetical protein